MELNGKIPDINYAPFNSQASMVIEIKKEDNSIIYHYIEIDSKITYIKLDNTEIIGTVLSVNTIKEIDTNEIIILPINSKIKTSEGFIGNTVINDDGNLDIKYTAEDIQVVTQFQVKDGFAMYGVNESITATGGMNIHVGRLSGILDGISFYFNKSVDVLIETGGTARRIDTIIIRKDQVSRKVSVEVKEGDNQNTPPTLTQNFLGVYEIPICDVAVDANQKNLQQNHITDRRYSLSSRVNRVGEIVAWAGLVDTIPNNAYLCDDALLLIADHQALFNVLKHSWANNRIPTEGYFYIPDGRGGVLKGAGSSTKYIHNEVRGLEGTYQGTAIRNIQGRISAMDDHNWAYWSPSGPFYSAGGLSRDWDSGSGGGSWKLSFDAARIVPTGQTNRDNNLAVNWIIYYKA